MSDLQISNINIGFAIDDLPDMDVWFSDLTDWLNYWKHITYGQQATLTPTTVPPYGYYVYTDPSFTGIPVTIGGIDYIFGSWQEALEVQAQLVQLEQSYEALRAALKDGNIIAENDIVFLTLLSYASGIVSLGWSLIPGNNITYNVYRDTNNGFTPSSGNLIASGVIPNSYIDNSLVTPATYYYKIIVVDSNGVLSDPSNQVSVVVAGASPTFISITPDNAHIAPKNCVIAGTGLAAINLIRFNDPGSSSPPPGPGFYTFQVVPTLVTATEVDISVGILVARIWTIDYSIDAGIHWISTGLIYTTTT